MKLFDQHWLTHSVAEYMLKRAQMGTWDGRSMTHYFRLCKAFHVPTGTLLILTRDVGYHSSGWWKNPDYERCFHLSLSYHSPGGESLPQDHSQSALWIDAIFGDDKRYLWTESPYSHDGKRQDVWHYRVFCDPAWKAILPRGEVYSRELTEAGWKSYSDVQAELARQQEMRHA